MILHGAPGPCSADQDVKTSSPLSATAKSFHTISAFGSSRRPFSGDKSSAGILLSARRRSDVAATNSADAAAAVVLSELTGLLPLKENKERNRRLFLT